MIIIWLQILYQSLTEESNLISPSSLSLYTVVWIWSFLSIWGRTLSSGEVFVTESRHRGGPLDKGAQQSWAWGWRTLVYISLLLWYLTATELINSTLLWMWLFFIAPLISTLQTTTWVTADVWIKAPRAWWRPLPHTRPGQRPATGRTRRPMPLSRWEVHTWYLAVSWLSTFYWCDVMLITEWWSPLLAPIKISYLPASVDL